MATSEASPEQILVLSAEPIKKEYLQEFDFKQPLVDALNNEFLSNRDAVQPLLETIVLAIRNESGDKFDNWFLMELKRFTIFIHLFRGSKSNKHFHQRIFQLWISAICSSVFPIEITRSLEQSNHFPGIPEKNFYNQYLLQIFQELILYEQLISASFENVRTEEPPSESVDVGNKTPIDEPLHTPLQKTLAEMFSDKALEFKKAVYWANTIDQITFCLLARQEPTKKELIYKYADYEVLEYRKFLYKQWLIYSTNQPNTNFVGQILEINSEVPQIHFGDDMYTNTSAVASWPKSGQIMIFKSQYKIVNSDNIAQVKSPFRAFAVNFFRSVDGIEILPPESEETILLNEINYALVKVKNVPETVFKLRSKEDDINSLKAEKEVLVQNFNLLHGDIELLKTRFLNFKNKVCPKPKEEQQIGLNLKEIDSLKKQIGELTSNRKKLEQEHSLNLIQLNNCQENVQSHMEKEVSLQNTISKLQDQLRSTQSDLASQTKVAANLPEKQLEIQKLNAALANLRKDLNEQTALCDQVQQEKKQCDDNLADLQNSAKSSQDIDASLQKELENKRQESTEIAARLDLAQLREKETKSKLENVQSQIAEFEKTKTENKAQITALQSQIVVLTRDLENANIEKDILSTQKQRLQVLETQRQLLEAALNENEEKLKHTEAQLGECQINLGKNTECIRDLQKASDDLKLVALQLSKTKQELQIQSEEKEDNENEISKKVKEIEAELDQCRKQTKQLDEDALILLTQVETAKEYVKDCENELDATEKRATERIASDQKTILQLEEDITDLSNELVGQKERLGDASENAVSGLESELNALRKQYDSLKAANYPELLIQKDEQISELKLKLDDKIIQYDQLLLVNDDLNQTQKKLNSELINQTKILEQQMETNKKDVEQLNQSQFQISQFKEHLAKTSEENTRFARKIQEQDKELEDFKVCAANRLRLEAKIDVMAKEITSLYTQNATITESLMNANIEKTDLQGLNERYSNQIAIVKSDFESQKSELERVKRELDSKTVEIMTLEDQCKIQEIVANESLLHKSIQKQFEACEAQLSKLQNSEIASIQLFGQGGLWNIPRDGKRIWQHFSKRITLDQATVSKNAHYQVFGSDSSFEQDIGNAIFLFRDILHSIAWTSRLFSNDIYFPSSLEKNTFISKVEDLWIKEPLNASFWLKTKHVLHENGLDRLIAEAEHWITGRRLEFLEHYKRNSMGNEPLDLETDAFNAWTLFKLIKESRSKVISLGIDSESFETDIAYLIMDRPDLSQIEMIKNWDIMFQDPQLRQILKIVLFGAGLNIRVTNPISNQQAVRKSISQIGPFVYPVTARKLYLISKGFIPFYLAPIRLTIIK